MPNGTPDSEGEAERRKRRWLRWQRRLRRLRRTKVAEARREASNKPRFSPGPAPNVIPAESCSKMALGLLFTVCTHAAQMEKAKRENLALVSKCGATQDFRTPDFFLLPSFMSSDRRSLWRFGSGDWGQRPRGHLAANRMICSFSQNVVVVCPNILSHSFDSCW